MFPLSLSLEQSQQAAGGGGPGGGRSGNPPNRGQGPPPSSMHIQKILDENAGLIQTIQEFQYAGKSSESMSYQVALHRNLVYLANLADPQQNVSSLLPVRSLVLFPLSYFSLHIIGGARACVCVCRVHKRRGDFPSRCAGLGAASRSVTSWPVGWLVLLPRRRKRFARVLVHRRGLASLLPTE